jgi:hypothetical protein
MQSLIALAKHDLSFAKVFLPLRSGVLSGVEVGVGGLSFEVPSYSSFIYFQLMFLV